MGPVNVLVPENVNVPLPTFTRPPVPVIAPENVVLEPLPPVVSVPPPRRIVPPAPASDPNVSLPANAIPVNVVSDTFGAAVKRPGAVNVNVPEATVTVPAAEEPPSDAAPVA